jgi:hypothetical protein
VKILFNSPIKYCILFIAFFSFGCDTLIKPSKEKLNEDAKNNQAYLTLAQTKKIIKTGDIITRTGNDFTSECLRKLCRRNTSYSHCGIASIENDSLFIYHALGGDWNPDQKILRESLEKFGNPLENRGIGIFRLTLSDSLKNGLANCAQNFRSQGIEFDMAFDLKTDNKMYCAEFVAKTIEKASKMAIKIHKSRIDSLEFIGVDDIFLNPASQKITQLIY